MHTEQVNHKPQAHARLCDENNEEENKEKSDYSGFGILTF